MQSAILPMNALSLAPIIMDSQVTETIATKASISTIPIEIATAIFSKLWNANDLASSVCLSMTCKSFKAIHEQRTNKRVVSADERSIRSLTLDEQQYEPRGVMVVFASLSTLIDTTQLQPSIESDELALWGPNIILQRSGTSNVFCLYRDVNSAFKPKIPIVPNSESSAPPAITRTTEFKKNIAWNYFQTSNNLALKFQMPGTLEAGGDWSLTKVLITWYDFADGQGGWVTEPAEKLDLGCHTVVKKWLVRTRSPGWANLNAASDN